MVGCCPAGGGAVGDWLEGEGGKGGWLGRRGIGDRTGWLWGEEGGRLDQLAGGKLRMVCHKRSHHNEKPTHHNGE